MPICRSQHVARAWCALLCCLSFSANAAIVDALEYYNAGLDHYFVTASVDEIGKLDSGFFVGWKRTGGTFKVSDASTPLAGGSPVCRFYGNPAAGLDSHFYSASPAECNAVQQKFPDAWLLESSNVFYVYLPNINSGACPAGSAPVYRTWNGRIDSNHRYTADPSVQSAMLARGYVAEGYGPGTLPVVMCSPTSAALPQCSLATSDSNPAIGEMITLSANCSGVPQTYSWSGCASSGPSCSTSASTAGPAIYAVIAGNASGMGAPATLTVIWRAMPTNLPPPVCSLTITAATDPPVIGSTILLGASCTGAPTGYTWSGCESGTARCTAYETTPGAHVYSVMARNEGGFSPIASITVTWASIPPAADLCGQFPSALRSTLGWNNGFFASTNYRDPPGFAWNGAWAVQLNVPPGATATQPGRIFVAEYVGEPTYREVTISRFACDFRTLDGSGSNGPIFRGVGSSVNTSFTVGAGGPGLPGMIPGQTYYINVRNVGPNGSISCSQQQQRCDALVEISLPS